MAASKKVQLIYFNAGGGHRAAADALLAQAQQDERPWDVERVNLSKVLQPDGVFKRMTGLEPEDLYNLRLKRGWTWGMRHELRLLQAVIRVAHPTLIKLLQAHWAATEPDLVVSLIPNFNRAIGESLNATLPGIPFMTVLTDLADHPPNFWIEPGLVQHIVCGSQRAYEQARTLGYQAQDITLTSGMILRSDFCEPSTTQRHTERRAMGLRATRPTGLVMFGGYGSRQMLSVARQLRDVQLTLICGHNDELAIDLRTQRARLNAPHVVLGYTPRVRHYMDLCDFFVGKPGPGSLSEALQRGLPVLTWINASTLPQERYNATWLRERQVGVVLRSLDGLRAGVDQLLKGDAGTRAKALAGTNNATREVLAVMQAQLARSEGPSPSQWLPSTARSDPLATPAQAASA